MGPFRFKSKSAALLLCLVAASAGCSKQELYTNLPEKEANEIMAILIEQGIDCQKSGTDGKSWSLSVDPDDFSRSIAILSELGRPRQTYKTIEELFPQTGFISSPAEQRIRLTYGLEQKLEETISGLPKVVSARVHLVLPDNNPFAEKAQPSSASVVVTHRPEAEEESMIPQIKQIVLGGVANLQVDSVSVELVESDDELINGAKALDHKAPAEPPMIEILSIQLSKTSVPRFIGVLAVAGIVFLFGLSLSVRSYFHGGGVRKLGT